MPDGVLYRVLEKLLILDGERLAYSALEVEHIGSVYETMMGFRLEKAAGWSIAVRPAKAHGAPASINLDELLTVAAGKRNEWLKERTDQALTGTSLNALKEAKTPNDAVVALGRKVAGEATPRIVPPGATVSQPSDERRRSGSHYTPRDLTRPIVTKALEPVLRNLGGQDSNPDQTGQDWNPVPRLEEAGQAYYEFRAALMVRNAEGLTKTYNRFHDPDESSADIARLRELHAAMDRAVLDAYGWTDLQPRCEFLLDYEEDDDEAEGGGRRRKKPWCYRWPDDFRDEVLARLLELNKRRAEQEALAGAAGKGKAKKRGGKKSATQPPETTGLF